MSKHALRTRASENLPNSVFVWSINANEASCWLSVIRQMTGTRTYDTVFYILIDWRKKKAKTSTY